MVFAFDRPDLDVAANVRRAAREEFDLAIAEVGETGFEVHGTIRNVRRRLKRIRSLLRLIRPVFDDYDSENAALRDFGAEVSDLRDTHALIEAADLLAPRAAPEVVGALVRVRTRLRARAAEHEASLERDAFLVDLRGRLREARVRSELWALKDGRPAVLVPGFVASYRKARAMFRQVEQHSDDDLLFHEWRKAVKYHWGHLKLLRDLVPPFADGRRRLAGRISSWLGDHQNLCVLRDHLELAGADRALIAAEIEDRNKGLRKKALRAGELLFAERPGAVRRRWADYCADWAASQHLGDGK